MKAITAYKRNTAKEYDQSRFQSLSGKMIHKIELSKVLNAISVNAIRDDKILEVGCGTGRILTELLELGFNVDGLDASKYMLEELRKKIHSKNINSKFFLSRSDKINCIDNSYDYVYCVRLLNQLESRECAFETVKEMLRVVRREGSILIEFVNSLRPRLGRNNTHTSRISIKDIKNFLKDFDVNIERIDGAFFLGMGAYKNHVFILKLTYHIDKLLSFLLPSFCSRVYITIRKNN